MVANAIPGPLTENGPVWATVAVLLVLLGVLIRWFMGQFDRQVARHEVERAAMLDRFEAALNKISTDNNAALDRNTAALKTLIEKHRE